MDCGPVCLRMIAEYFGKSVSLEFIKENASFSRAGVSLKSIMNAAAKMGMETMAVNISYNDLVNDVSLPCILHWDKNHFVVLPPQHLSASSAKIIIADPAAGKRKITVAEFKSKWLNEADEGIALLVQPGNEFEKATESKNTNGFRFLWGYLKKYKSALFKVLITLAITSVLTLIFPLLTQSLVDKGIQPKNVNFVLLVLGAQLALFFGNIFMEFVRARVTLRMNTKVVINIVSDFLEKLIRLPIAFFDARKIGDIQQRILDHERVKNLLSSHVLSTLFSFINFIVFSVILAYYNVWILLLFFLLSILSVVWIFIFINKRKELELLQFSLNAKNHSLLNELVTGMPEIKLNTAEALQREKWEKVQDELYDRNIQSLKLEQNQQFGSAFITQFKNILITAISALAVIDGGMTLGMMLAVSFIIGQMNAPLDQILNVIQMSQDAKLSLERLSEVHSKQEEVPSDAPGTAQPLPEGDITVNNLSFGYNEKNVLNNVSCKIPRGKITAIVGPSGSGKTTLLKLLLQFYKPREGEIRIGDIRQADIPLSDWRACSGVVMQDGYIFSDTVLENVTMRNTDVDMEKFNAAITIANAKKLIGELPLKEKTIIGNDGMGLSEGQKQRILIARAIYRNPEFLFFDEATSALDTNNESEIMHQLQQFYSGKTVVIIAHRLSTVKNAHQILVMDNGEIAETGTHEELVKLKGRYYRLVSEQLEMA